MSSKVFFVRVSGNSSPEERKEALASLFDASGAERITKARAFTAIKVHVGEKTNVTHMDAGLVRIVAEKVKNTGARAFLTETSSLYRSERTDAVRHLSLAFEHGFSYEKVGIPFIMADGLRGNHEVEVLINGELNKSVKIAGDVLQFDALYAIAHVTGHLGCGMGAAIKTLGMGLASRPGKMRQHAAQKPAVEPSLCVFCKKCMSWCPAEAIIEENGKARILSEKCLGCGQCMAMCNWDAIPANWGAESAILQKNIAEHAYGAVKHMLDRIFFFNLMLDMTKECDCFPIVQQKLVPDLGILASTDPVAIDKATLDLTEEAFGKNIARMAFEGRDPMHGLLHARKLGLGSTEYSLITI